MFDLSELNKLKRTRDKRAIPVVMLYLDENNEYTGKYEVFESGREASRSTGVAQGSISKIINSKNNFHTATHKRNGRKIIFILANSTKEEIKKYIDKIKNKKRKKNTPIPIKIIYLDENRENTGEYEIFESMSEASRVTGINISLISQIINKKNHHYTATHKENGRIVTFVFKNTTIEDINKHIRIIQTSQSTTPVPVKMIYLYENYNDTGECKIFENMSEASKITNIAISNISNIINRHKYATKHKENGRKITFEKI